MGKVPTRPIIFMLILLLLGSAWNIGSRLFFPSATFSGTLQHGIREYAEGRIDLAYAHFLRAAEMRPNDPVPHYMLAQSLEAMGREDQAIEQYQKTLRLDPQKAAPHYNLAVIYNRRKDLDAAAEELKQALIVQRNFYGARYMLSGIYLEQEKYEEAVKELDRLIFNRDLDRAEEIRIRTFLGRAYTGLEDTQKARNEWQRILRLDHTNEEAQEALSKLR
jgi:tetratricopeptide (TPR) repeat protein